MKPDHAFLAVIIPLFAWSFYRRIKRNVGRQRVRLPRIIFSLVIFSILILFFAAADASHPKLLAGICGGTATGLLLAILGLKLTKFEFTAAGDFYTPNLYLGLSLTMLLMGRIVYRMLILSNHASVTGQPPPFMASALTLYLFGLTAGYYLAYYTGVLLRRRHRIQTTDSHAI